MVLLSAYGFCEAFLLKDDEAKAARLVCLAVDHDFGRDDFAILAKVGAHLKLASVKVQAPHEDLVVRVLVHVEARLTAAAAATAATVVVQELRVRGRCT
jgi:hypothetical protein